VAGVTKPSATAVTVNLQPADLYGDIGCTPGNQPGRDRGGPRNCRPGTSGSPEAHPATARG
jgi:hypothetical protein